MQNTTYAILRDRSVGRTNPCLSNLTLPWSETVELQSTTPVPDEDLVLGHMETRPETNDLVMGRARNSGQTFELLTTDDVPSWTAMGLASAWGSRCNVAWGSHPIARQPEKLRPTKMRRISDRYAVLRLQSFRWLV